MHKDTAKDVIILSISDEYHKRFKESSWRKHCGNAVDTYTTTTKHHERSFDFTCFFLTAASNLKAGRLSAQLKSRPDRISQQLVKRYERFDPVLATYIYNEQIRDDDDIILLCSALY